jgi:hypothetical protein
MHHPDMEMGYEDFRLADAVLPPKTNSKQDRRKYKPIEVANDTR